MISFTVQTPERQAFVDITDTVQDKVRENGLSQGLCFLFCPHTTAAITLNENWDPDVRRDMGLALDRAVPENQDFRHAEGNSPAHVKTSMMSSDHVLFVEQGALVLGRWQGIYLAEFDGPRNRLVYVKFLPTP